MKDVRSIELNEVSREERLPGLDADFPYIATRAELTRYAVPWHWHRAVEIFLIESGTLEYTTPGGTWTFPAGSGGFLNANVLHSTRVVSGGREVVQLLHLFEPALLSAGPGSRIERKFILPLTASLVELLPLYPEDAVQTALLGEICHAFSLDADAWDYELAVRESMSTVWRGLLALARPEEDQARAQAADSQIKAMLVYIHEHLREDISVDQLAAAGCVSRRSCFRLFRETLHTTPLELIRDYRLQEACRLLARTDSSVTNIAAACGFSSASYFGRMFARYYGCTPVEYRKMARS